MIKGQRHSSAALAKMRLPRTPKWRAVGITLEQLKEKVWEEFQERFQRRFWAQVDRSNGDDKCWPWTGRDRKGYGYIYLLGREVRATRISWLLTYGTISSDLSACHRCDNPACVNPNHLFMGTHQENMDDMRDKGRRAPAPVGQDHPMAKLTDNDIRAIRLLLADGVSQVEIARRFTVTPSTISWIASRKHWAHVA